MNPYLMLLLSTVSLLAVIAAFFLAVLTRRNPFCPRALRRSFLESAVSTTAVTAFCFAAAFQVSALTALGMHPFVALPLTALTAALSCTAVWRLGDIGGRLARADNGLSPFDRDLRTVAVSGTPPVSA